MNHVIQVIEGKIFVVTESVQGPAGPGGSGGGSTTLDAVAATSIGGHRLVVLNEAGRAEYATNSNPNHLHRVVGLTTGAADADSGVSILTGGQIAEASWQWDVNLPIYLSENGVLTQQVPSAPQAKFLLVVGFPTSSKSMFLNIREPITLTN